MSLSDFIILEELGNGSFGNVCKAKRIKDEEIYAIKKVNVLNLNQKEKENTINEIRILASINHQNIISYKDAFYDPRSNSICTVMEFADDTDIEKKITQKNKNKTTFSESEIWTYIYNIVRGLKCLHDNKILHRDLKPANVFLFKNGNVKIGDMNVSKIAKNGLVYTQTGTPFYASPEVWKDRPYDNKSDIWSLGCIIYELCCLKPPFRGTTLEGVFSKIIKGVFDPIPHSYSRELSHLVSSLLQIKPGTRPSSDQILHMINHNKKINFDNKNKQSDYEKISLLQTIKFPENINQINNFLPKSNYIDLNSNMTQNDENFYKDLLNERKKKKVANSLKLDNIAKKKEIISDLNKKNKYSELINQLSNNIISDTDKKIDKILDEYHEASKIRLMRRGRNEDIIKIQSNLSSVNINKSQNANALDKSINTSSKKDIPKYNRITTSPNNNEYKPIIYKDKNMNIPSISNSPNNKYKFLVLPSIVNKRISYNNNFSNLETSSKEHSSNLISNNYSINLDTETKINNKQKILSSILKISELSIVPESNKMSIVEENKSDNLEQKPITKVKRKVPKSALISHNKGNQVVSNSLVLEPWKI